jgi:tRNA nucleotidyltransferase (CCA-adding enzyme)
VTLEDDLLRRDLTINAMARDARGQLIDPHRGARDLEERWLRHVSPAFAEDPVRTLRVARFSARYALLGFQVAPETLELMRAMVADGEIDHLVPERVWQELASGLMAQRPSRRFDVLRGCGALARLLPEVDRLWGVPQPAAHHPEIDTGVHLMLVLGAAARLQVPLTVRYACLCHDLGKGSTPRDEWPRHIGHEARSAKLARAVAERLRVPNDCRELADTVAREHTHVHGSGGFGAAALVRLLERCDAFRRPERFAELLLACECDARGRTGLEARPYPQRARLAAALAAAQAIDGAEVAAAAATRGAKGPAIGAARHDARVAAVAATETSRSASSGT